MRLGCTAIRATQAAKNKRFRVRRLVRVAVDTQSAGREKVQFRNLGGCDVTETKKLPTREHV